MRIIDAHVHVLDNYAPMAPFEDSGRCDRLLRHMDDCGVEKTVMVPVVADFAPHNNAFCGQLAREYPDRLATMTAVGLDQPDAAERIARAREEFGAVGISDYPSASDWTPMLEPACAPIWQALGDHDLVCSLQVRPPNYAVVLELARRYPSVPFVMNHLALPAGLDPDDAAYGGLLDARSRPNLFVKASGFYAAAETPWDFRCPQALGFLSRLVRELGADRLLWGSDWPPVGSHLTYRQNLEIVRTFAQDLDNEGRALVLGENAARVFKI